MNIDLISKLNKVLENTSDRDKVIKLTNELLNTISISEQLEIHSLLSFRSLEKLITIQENLDLNTDVKEHLLWFYFKQKIEKNDQSEVTFIINAIVKYYQKEPLIALESLIIDMFKKNIIKDEHVEIVNQYFFSSEIKKQLLIYRIHKSISEGNFINDKDIESLLNMRAFTTIEEIINKGFLKKTAYHIFKEPTPGEKDAKHKKRLFEKVSKLTQ